MTKYGSCLNHICQGNVASGAGLLRIIAVLSMRCFGYCAQEHPGVTCLPVTGSGAVFILKDIIMIVLFATLSNVDGWDTVSRYHSASVWYDLARYFTATIPEMAGAVESGGGRKTEGNHLYRWEKHAWEQAEGISAQPYRIGLMPGGWILPWAAGGGRKEQ